MNGKRRHFSSSEKVTILREHLVEKQPVSTVCDRYKLNPNQFYRWQSEFFANGHLAFEAAKRSRKNPEQERIRSLESKLAQRDEGIAELMSEYVMLKKNLG